MYAPLSRPLFRLPLQRRIRITCNPLPYIVETMRRMMRHLLRQRHIPVPLLKVLGEVGQAMQLVKDGHHVAGAVGVARVGYGVGGGEIVGLGAEGWGEDDVAARF
jgi:hypothetical protein